MVASRKTMSDEAQAKKLGQLRNAGGRFLGGAGKARRAITRQALLPKSYSGATVTLMPSVASLHTT
jgi:hypothetical protein